MMSKLIALAGAMVLALGILAIPAAAAVAPEASVSLEAAMPAEEGPMQLANGWHAHCGWGPGRGWWHYHTRWGARPCQPNYQYQYQQRQYPRCFWNRWGRWVCR